MKNTLKVLFLTVFLIAAVQGCKDKSTLDPAGNPDTELVISSIEPSSASVGNKVVIIGKGFSAKISENIIKFGGIEAVIDSASATRLVTKVPVGAKTGKVSVSVNGKSAEGKDIFEVSQFTVGKIDQFRILEPTIRFVNTYETTINNSLSFGIQVQPVTTDDHGFVYSKSSVTTSPDLNTGTKLSHGEITLSMIRFPHSYEDTLTKLEPNTEYSIRGYGRVRNTVDYGKVLKFKTLPVPNITDKSPIIIYQLINPGTIAGINVYTGKVEWEAKLDQPNSFSSCLFLINGNKIIIPTNNGTIYCVDRISHKLLWKNKISESDVLLIHFRNIAIMDEKIFVKGVSNELLCLDINNGSLIWKFSTEREILGMNISAENIYINDNTSIFSVNRSTGKLNWRREYPTNVSSIFRVLNSRDRLSNLYRIDGSQIFAINPKNGEITWESINEGFSSIVWEIDNIVYVRNSKIISAFNKNTGSKLWDLSDQITEIITSWNVSVSESEIISYVSHGYNNFIYKFDLKTGTLKSRDRAYASIGDANFAINSMYFFTDRTNSGRTLEVGNIQTGHSTRHL